MVAKFLLSLAVFIYAFNSNQASLCYKTKSEWEVVCNKTYHGVTDGGRCFFAMNNETNWADSWKSCANQGGSLAQVHTKSEFSRIAQYLWSYFNTVGHVADGLVWIAMRKDPSSTAVCAMDLKLSFWYTNATNYDSKFKAGNTWIRNSEKADCELFGPCDVLWLNNNAYQFGDVPCSHQHRPLCVVTNWSQNFTLIPNACFAEQVMETFPSSDVESCGKKCTSFGWCRGFNVRIDGDVCELFPWSLNDSGADKAKSTPNADCYAYSYQP